MEEHVQNFNWKDSTAATAAAAAAVREVQYFTPQLQQQQLQLCWNNLYIVDLF
jgi:hypothetical protein